MAGQRGASGYYDVRVIRDPSKRLLSDVFVGTLVTLISIAMVLMGCEPASTTSTWPLRGVGDHPTASGAGNRLIFAGSSHANCMQFTTFF